MKLRRLEVVCLMISYYEGAMSLIPLPRMLDKTRDLADAARSMGTHVFHLPAFNSNIHEVNNGQTDDTSTVGDFLSNTLSRFFKEDHSH